MLDNQQADVDAKTLPRTWFPRLVPALTPLYIVTSVGDHPV